MFKVNAYVTEIEPDNVYEVNIDGLFKSTVKGKNKMSFMNFEALSNSIDFNVNSVYDVFVYFVDIASDCLIETRFVDCIDAYGFRDVLDDGVFYVPGAVCLGYRCCHN